MEGVMFINDLNKAMISYKTIALVREVFDPHIEIEVPSNIKSLRRKFVDEFLENIQMPIYSYT